MKASVLLLALSLIDPDDEVQFTWYNDGYNAVLTPVGATAFTDYGDFTMNRGDLEVIPEPTRTLTIRLEKD
jgi:hypothetical protein